MNTHKVTFGLATLAVVAATGAVVFFAGCSTSSTTNTGPTMDASPGSDASKGSETSTGKKDTGSSTDSPVETDAGDAAVDVADTGPTETPDCGSDSATCNSCLTEAGAIADPYNACSPYTVNCVPFTTTVPSHPAL